MVDGSEVSAIRLMARRSTTPAADTPTSLRAHDEPFAVTISRFFEASVGATGVVKGISQTTSVDKTDSRCSDGVERNGELIIVMERNQTP